MNSKQEILSSVAQSAYRIRRYSVRMGEVQGQGYVGQAVIAVLRARELFEGEFEDAPGLVHHRNAVEVIAGRDE